MDYTITIFKKRGVPLYTLWIDTPDAEPQPGTVWQVVQTVQVTTEKPIPATLCGLLLMSEETSDKLFRQIADTWLGPVVGDAMNSCVNHTSQEEASQCFEQSRIDS